MKYAVKLLKNIFHPLNIPQGVEIQPNQMVLVRTENGEEAAKVIQVNSEVSKAWEKAKPEVLNLIRPMNQKDLEALSELKQLETEGYKTCSGLIKNHNLNMNLIQCRYTFDRKKISFYYTAPERVDFRNLLKDLTQIFKRIRIDLRHVGVRDETSIVEGCGLCGRPFCCTSFLRSFSSINIKLAKDQGMPITPGKISGTCGRLLCCMNYEYKNYIDAAAGMPPIGSSVMTPEGIGKVCSLHFLNGKLAVKLEDGKIKDFTKNEIEMIDTDVNIEIETPFTYQETSETEIDIKQLEDD